MSFVSFNYLLFLGIICLVFYGLPVKYRKWCLLPASLFFFVNGCGILVIWLLYSSLVAWGYGLGLERKRNAGKISFLCGAVILLLLPLVGFKWGHLLQNVLFHTGSAAAFVAPLGISFYTLSLIGYCTDIYRGKYAAQKNFGKFLLFSSFFPHIVQGPIARYDELEKSLFRETKFDYDSFCKGVQLILWGFMQKLIIADRAAVLVNTVFAPDAELMGMYILIAFITYSIQLYADFAGCVNIARGSAQLFGISLARNFEQPYFAVSIQDFWRRWHLSLSSWLRDYVYIPLGGNRKGKLRKCCNTMVVFAVSGLWHGAGFHYFMWGLLHGFFLVFGELLKPVKGRWLETVRVRQNGTVFVFIKRLLTFGLVTFAWGLFRADSMIHFLQLLKNMVSVFNPQIIFSGGAFEMSGLRLSSYLAVLGGTAIMTGVDFLHERGIGIRDRIAQMDMPVRWVIYIAAVMTIIIFGMYGPGYSASQFIYGQF